MNKVHLVSFDIFDTLVTRNLPEPNNIFLLIQKTLNSSDIYKNLPFLLKNDFAKIRYYTEKFARENLRINENKKEITFDDIYEYLKINFNLSDSEINMLKFLELKTEKENLVPIYKNIELLKQYVTQKKRVILISDMYFSKDIIRDFLKQFDDIFDKIEIYISSDYNLKKSDSSFFKYIKQQLEPLSWLHIGDDFKSDVLMPAINGIKTKQYKSIKLKNYEKYLLLKSKNDIKIKLAIGCAKNLRLANNNQKYQFGCSFAGVILYNYVKWVLSQCESRNIKHLYFVARDGYILQKIANIIIKNNNLPLVTHYFYTSRLACNSVKLKGKEDILELYLKQEIVDSDNKIAFIDINGSGKTQEYITEILNKSKLCHTYNFYLHNITTMKQSKLAKKLFMVPMVDTQDWIEFLCRCPQGQTIDYEIDTDKKVVPIKEQINNEYLIKWGIEDYLNGILDFSNTFSKIEKQNNVDFSNINHFLILNDYIHNYLDKQTADIIGSIPFATKGNEKRVKEVAPKINIINLFYPKYTDYISIARCNLFTKPLVKMIKTIINPRTYAFINKEKKLAYIKICGLKINISKLIWRIQ